MLVLSRDQDQSIVIQTTDGPVEVMIVKTGRTVRIGVKAPKNVTVLRKELIDTNPQSGSVATQQKETDGQL